MVRGLIRVESHMRRQVKSIPVIDERFLETLLSAMNMSCANEVGDFFVVKRMGSGRERT